MRYVVLGLSRCLMSGGLVLSACIRGLGCFRSGSMCFVILRLSRGLVGGGLVLGARIGRLGNMRILTIVT